MQQHEHHSAPRTPCPGWSAAALLLLAACGASFGTSGGGEPGPGGGPRGPGGTGNPLSVVLAFSVVNDAAVERTETICVSVPFPAGGYADLGNVVVSGHQTAWRVLQRWPDGTVRVAQAQFTDVLAPGQRKLYRVARDVPAATGPLAPHDWVAQLAGGLEIGAQVLDTFQVPYRGFVDGAGTVLQETPLVQTRRHRAFHRATAGGIGRDYLTSTFYLTEYRDVPVVLVDWILGNDYLGADVIQPGNNDPNLRPLGMIDVRQAHFMVKGVTAVQGYRPVEEAIGTVQSLADGFSGLPVMQDTYLEDGQTRRYRFLLYLEHPSAAPGDRQRWRDTATAMIERPLMPLALADTWLETGGAGLVGGPIRGPADAFARAEGEFQSWAGGNHFGTWGSRGDPVKTGTTGTPRNHPLSPELAHAIQSNNPRLLTKLEQMAWAQAMRPYHLFGLQVGAEQDILLWDGVPVYPGSRDLSRESLGRRALWANDPYPQYRTMTQTGSARAHGWEHFDHEHWTTDLLFDYWTVSGDEWAREELRQLGESLKGLMRLSRYNTAAVQAVRAEGWTMQGFVQVYQATGDQALKDFAIRRLREVVDPGRMQNHASKALVFQGNYVGTGFPLNHRFYMPWQHGALFYGYLAAAYYLQEPLFLQICEETLTCVEYAWVTNYQDPARGFVPNGIRYYVPVEFNGAPIPPHFWDADPQIGVRWGDSPLGGAHTFLIGGLHLLADWARDGGTRARALQRAQIMVPAVDDNARWSKWVYCIPPHFAP
jgi:hypothetical protein